MFNSKGQEHHWECWQVAVWVLPTWGSADLLHSEGFPGETWGGVWPGALLPVERSNYGS